jgi:2-phospho-L-lactate guanylyltransferase (CobY/MobA/RfbA family)
VLAVVPVKGRDGAKTRLAPLLQPEERTRLVLGMLEWVLEACAGAESITGTLLVTPDPGFAPRGVELLRDAGTSGMRAPGTRTRSPWRLGTSAPAQEPSS